MFWAVDPVLTAKQEVRVLSGDGLVGTWNPPDLVSIATSCGSLLALVHSSAVTVIRIQDTSGQVEVLQTLHFSQQVSAIAVLESPKGMSQVRLPCNMISACDLALLSYVFYEQGRSCLTWWPLLQIKHQLWSTQ